MSRGRAGFYKSQSQTDEAVKLQEEARKAGLLGSVGSLLGSFALMPFLGPGASLAAKSIMTGLGSTLGNVVARKIGGADIDKGGLWHKGQKEQISKGLNTQAITGGLTSMLTAGITPWLKGGMEGGAAGLFKGGTVDPLTNKAVEGTAGQGKFWQWGVGKEAKSRAAEAARSSLIDEGLKPITDVSAIYRDKINEITKIEAPLDGFNADLVTVNDNQIYGPTKTNVTEIPQEYNFDTPPEIKDNSNVNQFHDLTVEEIMDLPPIDRESSGGFIYEPSDITNLKTPKSDTLRVKKQDVPVDDIFKRWEMEDTKGLY